MLSDFQLKRLCIYITQMYVIALLHRSGICKQFSFFTIFTKASTSKTGSNWISFTSISWVESALSLTPVWFVQHSFDYIFSAGICAAACQQWFSLIYNFAQGHLFQWRLNWNTTVETIWLAYLSLIQWFYWIWRLTIWGKATSETFTLVYVACNLHFCTATGFY